MSLDKNTSKPIPQLCNLQTPKNNWPILPISREWMFIYYGYGSNLQASNVGLKSRHTKWQYLYKSETWHEIWPWTFGVSYFRQTHVVSIHIIYIYIYYMIIYDYICTYIYIYIHICMVMRSFLLFRWSLKFDLVWSQVATSQRPQPTNDCCGQEPQKCPTCPFSEYLGKL